MSHTTILTRSEIESMGPPAPDEIADTGISEGFLCDLALKHVAMLPEPRVGSSHTAVRNLRLCRTCASLVKRLRSYDEVAIDSERSSLDRNSATSLS